MNMDWHLPRWGLNDSFYVTWVFFAGADADVGAWKIWVQVVAIVYDCDWKIVKERSRESRVDLVENRKEKKGKRKKEKKRCGKKRTKRRQECSLRSCLSVPVHHLGLPLRRWAMVWCLGMHTPNPYIMWYILFIVYTLKSNTKLYVL